MMLQAHSFQRHRQPNCVDATVFSRGGRKRTYSNRFFICLLHMYAQHTSKAK